MSNVKPSNVDRESNFAYKSAAKYGYWTIPIYAEQWVHEWVFEEFLEKGFPKDAKILILWCWAWALDQRILDAGYTNITAVDIVKEFYQCKNTTLLVRDLNLPFHDIWVFDVIFAIEIIEHLENQFHFIREMRNILSPNGHIFLSSPNVESIFSRMDFLTKGFMNSFTHDSLDWLGHIQPIFMHILEHAIGKNGLRIEKYRWLCEKRRSDCSLIGGLLRLTILPRFLSGNNFIINLMIVKHHE